MPPTPKRDTSIKINFFEFSEKKEQKFLKSDKSCFDVLPFYNDKKQPNACTSAKIVGTTCKKIEMKEIGQNMNVKRQNKKTVKQKVEDGYDMDLLSDYVKELIKPENVVGEFDSTDEMLKATWDDNDDE